MELESLKRQIAFLETNGAEISKLVTDRHIQVAAYVAKEKPNIEHTYDVWHIAKGNFQQYILCTQTIYLYHNTNLLYRTKEKAE